MKFKLTEREVRLSHYNARKEKHGEEDVDAADLKFEVDLPMTDLGMFHPKLEAALYDREKLDAAGAHTELTFPRLEPIKWDETIAGGGVWVHYGPTKDGDMLLANATVDKFVLEPRQGGSVGVTFRVQFHPDELQAGRLATTLLGGTVRLSVVPPQEPF